MGSQAALIEILDRDGQVRALHKIAQWPLSLGRSPDCDLVLADAHVAGQHALLQWGEEGAELVLLPSLNGGWVDERRLQAGESAALGVGGLFRLGNTWLRLRTSAQALPAEQPLHHEASGWRHHAWWPALLLLWMGLLWFDQWSALNPGSPWIDYSGAVLAPLSVLLVWAALWSLINQLFQHRFPFVMHLKRALVALTGLHVLSAALPLVAYSLSLPRLMAIDAIAFPLGLAALLWWHASAVWPRAKRWMAVMLGALLLLGLLLNVAKRQEQQHWLGPAYLSALPPPALRLASPKPPEVLIDSLRTLREQLAKQAKRDNEEPSLDGAED
ncbi:FHA domain-containing protein [Pelomonas sp. SE-A7]|uniref:FHA domain-containing protein n=1 Tax=Pelomonas sp. SE-A7 TaxID=3054953 RepID=UPI00259CC6AB|nr:FHA domain-containing protein [Pelomonas sp. SE-A7]MDM4766349.1 FHA domain-containing protein [Pelomonas sp. SE-A7]